MGISPSELTVRLERQDLLDNRLIRYYDTLHTQSAAYVADDIIETLYNYEHDIWSEMKDYILYRKITRIILQLADELQISTKRALLLFYSTKVGQQLHDPKYGYQIMSDTYIVNDIKAELRTAGEESWLTDNPSSVDQTVGGENDRR